MVQDHYGDADSRHRRCRTANHGPLLEDHLSRHWNDPPDVAERRPTPGRERTLTAPDKSYNFEARAGIDGSGVPLRFAYNHAVELDGDPGGIDAKFHEQSADVEARGHCPRGAIDMNQDFRTGWFV